MAIDYIPHKFYVARQPRNSSTPDEILGFMQPMIAEGFKQRKDTADRWAQGHRRTVTMDAIEVENKPLTGFSLTENKRRMMNKNVVWRVLHPEGFEFEITSDNFSDFLMEIDMHQGVIQTPMLFVRRSGENYLTYEGSRAHKKAVSQDQIEAKVSLKDLQIGDHFTMKNGRKAEYLGGVHCISLGMRKELNKAKKAAEKPEFDINRKSKRFHVYKNIHSGKVTSTVDASTSLQIISIDKKAETPGCIQDTLAFLRGEIKKISTRLCFDYDLGDVVEVSDKPFTLNQCNVTLEPVQFSTAQTGPIVAIGGYSSNDHYLLKLKGEDELVGYYYSGGYSHRADSHASQPRRTYALKDGSTVYVQELEWSNGYYFRSHWEVANGKRIDPADVEQAYRQVITRV